MKINWREKETDLPHGIVSVRVDSFEEFVSYIDFVHRTTNVNKQYIWRGQRCLDWVLNTTIDRKLHRSMSHARNDDSLKFEYFVRKHLKLSDKMFSLTRYEIHETVLSEHLNEFKFALRGRRGSNPPNMHSENDWWALGQHHGLSTPLLDWTGSPYVACFFAFEKEIQSNSDERVVYGLWEAEINSINETIERLFSSTNINNFRVPIIEFFRPFSDENPRLVSQKGLFTRGPLGIDIEKWIKLNCKTNHNAHILIKIILPNNIRVDALRSLNRMNINHLSLFPDLSGAAKYSNLSLDDYGYKGG